MREPQPPASFRRFVLAQERFNALVEGLGGVDVLQDLFVAVPKRVKTHYGDDVGRAVHVIS